MLSFCLRRAGSLSTQVLSRSFTSIPVIDVGPLVVDPQSRGARSVAAELDKACRDVGFFYVTNHGVPDKVCSGVLQEARGWFQLPEEVKNQLQLGPNTHYRGYQQLGANVTRYDGGYQRDWHEAIDMYKEESEQDVLRSSRPFSPIHGPNLWPSQLPSFERALREYIEHMKRLGADLMTGIALGLDLAPDYFGGDKAGIDESYWCMRIIHYPPLSEGTEHKGLVTPAEAEATTISREAAAAAQGSEVSRAVQLSCGEHTDYGLLTLVNQEQHVTALQVKNAAGQWINATPIPGTFVCNIGDMLKVWTNGRYTPTAHRVINTDPTRSRVSIPFFYEPAYEAVVAPVPQLSAQAPLREALRATRYGSHLESKVLNNFEL